jgi:hypothetical protein
MATRTDTQAVMAHADWIVDLGPSAGHDGGRIVFEGTPADLVAGGMCPRCEGIGKSTLNHLSITRDTISIWLRSASETCATTAATWSIVPLVESRSRSHARVRLSLSCGRYRRVGFRQRLY